VGTSSGAEKPSSAAIAMMRIIEPPCPIKTFIVTSAGASQVAPNCKPASDRANANLVATTGPQLDFQNSHR
jgi:hypothetical protein